MEDILLRKPKESNKNYPENPTSRNSVFRFLYENFNYFIDEISMSGSNMLAKIKFRLQDIMEMTNLWVVYL